MENETILVVEDSDRLRRFIKSALTKEKYLVHEAPDVETAFRILKEECLDLVLLDLRLGERDGLDILTAIRRQDEELPVIIVSSIDDRQVKVGGFEIGCDDYITKPFYVDELLVRVRRLLKRRRPRPAGTVLPGERLESGPFMLDLQSMQVHRNGEPLVMRRKLFELFVLFVRNEGAVLTPEMLFDRAWDSREEMNENSLYVHIRHLRTLVEEDPARPRYITTIRNSGYRYSSAG